MISKCKTLQGKYVSNYKYVRLYSKMQFCLSDGQFLKTGKWHNMPNYKEQSDR